jgi:hypothetical protein
MARSQFVAGIGQVLKKIGQLLLVLLALMLIGGLTQLCSEIWPFKPPTPTVRPTTTPTPEASIRGNVVDLLEEGVIEIDPKGSGIDGLDLAVRRLLDELLEVEIPIGTLFVEESGGIQNMVVRRQVTIVISRDDWYEVEVPVACANKNRIVPDLLDSFDIVMAPEEGDLQAVLSTIGKCETSWGWEYGSFNVVQAAIWIVTDDATYSGLGTLVTRRDIFDYGTRAIDEDDAARAMRLVDEAGIDITSKRIWQDRELIATRAEDAVIVEWIRQREQAGG